MVKVEAIYKPNGNTSYFTFNNLDDAKEEIERQKEALKFWNDPEVSNYKWIIEFK